LLLLKKNTTGYPVDMMILNIQAIFCCPLFFARHSSCLRANNAAQKNSMRRVNISYIRRATAVKNIPIIETLLAGTALCKTSLHGALQYKKITGQQQKPLAKLADEGLFKKEYFGPELLTKLHTYST
jgi:hypothetical protein